MRLLLDTHIFLWCVKDDRRLTNEVREIIERSSEVYVSSVSIWEIGIKIGLKKIDVDILEIVKAITLSGYSELPVTAQHAIALLKLPNLHRDPFDRMLVAQAMTEPLTFLTADFQLKGYSDLIQFIG